MIALGMSPFSPESTAVRAGRLLLAEIDFLAKRGAAFGFETTLSGRGHLKLIRGLKERGYERHFFYLWVHSAELALSRIKERVSRAGMTCRKMLCGEDSSVRSEGQKSG